jgi:hypothetical protein
MTRDPHWNTALISRSRAGIVRFFDRFTLVEPGLVRPALSGRPDHRLRARAARPTSTITREVNRNRGPAGYQAAEALGPDTPAGARLADSGRFLKCPSEDLLRHVEYWHTAITGRGPIQAEDQPPENLADGL